MNNTKTNSSWLKTFSIGFSIISFGITLAIVGYIVLTAKQNQPANQQPTTTSPTISALSPAPNGVGANWKIYTNKKLGYSFKYPYDYIVTEYNPTRTIIRNPASEERVNSTDDPSKRDDNQWVNIFIEVENSPNNFDTSMYINTTYVEPLKTKADQGDPYSKISLKELQSSLRDYRNGNINGKYLLLGGETFAPTVIAVKNNKVFIFVNDPIPQTGASTSTLGGQTFDQILSTFRFIP